jgi:hypothetical protein
MKLFNRYVDIADLDEDERIRQIGETTMKDRKTEDL